ncbi:YfiR family protein [Aeoliella mucimassa]|uniref:YfiR family protein n=1 Tax=Aeoliella mucimassa TaxID=2527972 RepID=UPI0011A3D03F|nr:YfiR family protein [Aeoliella mucimassa]
MNVARTNGASHNDCSCHASSTLRTRCLLRARRLALLLLLIQGCCSGAFAQTVVVNREYDIKAAFLYQFSKYVEWPSDSFSKDDQPFVIGIASSNPFGSSLDQIAERKKVSGRTIEIVTVTETSEVAHCHILFIPGIELTDKDQELLAAAADVAVLTVGESDEFISAGGSMQFYLENNKVRFACSRSTAAGSRLKISSKLLSLAKIIDPQTASSTP